MEPIIFKIVLYLISLAFGTAIAFTIVARLLTKSNNLGAKNLTETTFNFVILPADDGPHNTKLSTWIYNPVIRSHTKDGFNDSYIKAPIGDIEDEIDDADLSGISWHK